MRRNLFVAQDKLSSTEKKANSEASEAAALRRAVVSQSAEKETQDKLLADLRAKLDAKEGDVSSEGALVTVNLVDEVLFKSGDANLAPRGKEVLAKVGDVLKKLTDKQILIGGHTDTVPIHTPQFPSNWELSSARAVNVVHFLAETVGVDPAKLTAAGFGEFHPRSKKIKAKNRRIEILLTPAVESAKK
jgi:chemotaxis protein MotB